MSSRHLSAASAAWDDTPRAGEWIEPLLGPFGPSLAYAVPQAYAAYAVVPIPQFDDEPDAGDEQDDYSTLAALLDVLDPFTGDQAVHVGLWEGWGAMSDPGEDPRTAPAAYILGRRPRFAFTARARRERAGYDDALVAAREWMAERRVQRPAAEPLDLPARRYYLWTGPLRSALALRHAVDLPSLVWPDDRSWFVGAPIYTREIAIGGPADVIGAVLDDERLATRRARSATPDDVLDIDD